MRPHCAITSFIFVLFMAAGCKKDKATKQSMAELFKDKAWSGEIKYTNKSYKEPYYVSFDANNNLIWHEAGGNLTGTYILNEDTRTIKLVFTGSGSNFTAVIDDDNKFAGITYGGTYSWAITDGEINNSGSDNLDNTTWVGTSTFYPGGSTLNNVSWQFKPSSQAVLPGPKTTTYSKTGAMLSMSITTPPVAPDTYFVVFNKNKMKAVVIIGTVSTVHTGVLDLTKQ